MSIQESILKILSSFPDGASLEDIRAQLNEMVSKRTVQRHLSLLVEEGKINAIGQARARLYVLPKTKIPLSAKASLLLSKMQEPLHMRKSVGYIREFLETYEPNVTYYLPLISRQHLHDIGKTDGDRPAGTYARQIYDRLLIDLSWNSSRLEGNTYSLLETERLLELSEISEGKDVEETQMILNHKVAIEFLVSSAETLEITRYTILNLHALLSQNLLGNPVACGSLRTIPIAIAKSRYTPIQVPQLLAEYFSQIIDKAKAIIDPFEQAFFLMVHLPYLQPFVDVNKRVSRLSANIPLIAKNLSPLSFVDVPQREYINGLLAIYELNQIELLHDVFIWAYERSCLRYSSIQHVMGKPDPFRMRYRVPIAAAVLEVVAGKMDKGQAIITIRKLAQALPASDQERFIETIEVELGGLHEGNIERYKISTAAYSEWKKQWR